MIRGVAFDLEGTVVNVERAHHDAFLTILTEHGCPMSIERAIEDIPRFIGGGDPVVLAGIKEYTGCKQSVEELLVRKMELYRATLKGMAAEGRVRPRDGFHLVLGALRDMQIPTTIGSLTPIDQAFELMGYAGIMRDFDRAHMILREDVENRKPAPDCYLRTAALMGIHPSEQLVFEDSATGIQAALAAGCQVIAMPVYTEPRALRQLIELNVRRIFLDWREMNIHAVLQNIHVEMKGDGR